MVQALHLVKLVAAVQDVTLTVLQSLMSSIFAAKWRQGPLAISLRDVKAAARVVVYFGW